MRWAVRGSRWLLAAVFLYAGIVKLGAGERFAITIAQFFILPQGWVSLLAATLPWLEVIVGMLLLIPRTSRAASFAAGGLLVIFLAALAWAWSQGITVDCGCFGGKEDEPVEGNPIPLALARDAALLGVTLLLAVRRLR